MDAAKAKRELKQATLALEKAEVNEIKCQTAATMARVDLQRAMMRFCDASETVRRLPTT